MRGRDLWPSWDPESMATARLRGGKWEMQEGSCWGWRKEDRGIILNQRQSELLKKTVRQRERCSVVDRDREGVGEGKEERQVFELAANPQILEDFWDNASFSLGWLIYDQQELGYTGAEHMRQLCGLELLGAMAGSSQENRIVSRSEDGGITALMGTH